MPKVTVSIDGVVLKEVRLVKDRTTLGRRPYNDVVIDHLAVSGEHAVLQMTGGEVYLEDLNSTNGSYINGKAIKKQLLQSDDVVEIGKYRIRFQGDDDYGHEKSPLVKTAHPNKGPMPVAMPVPLSSASSTPPAPPSYAMGLSTAQGAAIKVLSGAATGRTVDLVKVVTTIGKPGLAIAAITRRPNGFVIAHVEGSGKPTVNGIAVDAEPSALHDGDVIELAGTQMQFLHK